MVQAERKRTVGYLRVSTVSQMDGHSLDAQERLFHELCRNRGWDDLGVYREEGKSAHSDSIKKRPELRRLLEDSAKDVFDHVVVHTLDRWSRNQRIMLETLATLGNNDVALISITENIDYSTPHGMLFTQMLGSFAQYFSDSLGTHVKKGIDERARQGLHLGAVPFGYESCWQESKGYRKLVCEPEHPGGIHVHPQEGPAVWELFRQYATGTVHPGNPRIFRQRAGLQDQEHEETSRRQWGSFCRTQALHQRLGQEHPAQPLLHGTGPA